MVLSITAGENSGNICFHRQNILRRVETMGYKPGKLVKTPQNIEVIKGAVIEKQ